MTGLSMTLAVLLAVVIARAKISVSMYGVLLQQYNVQEVMVAAVWNKSAGAGGATWVQRQMQEELWIWMTLLYPSPLELRVHPEVTIQDCWACRDHKDALMSQIQARHSMLMVVAGLSLAISAMLKHYQTREMLRRSRGILGWLEKPQEVQPETLEEEEHRSEERARHCTTLAIAMRPFRMPLLRSGFPKRS